MQHTVLSLSFAKGDRRKRGRWRDEEQEKAGRDGRRGKRMSARGRKREGAIMRVSLLTECVEILDGHTTNKRDPSDDIELRSADDDRLGGRTWRDVARDQQHSNSAWTPPDSTESTKPSAMAVYAAGSKSCICHDAMGGVARGRRVPKASRRRPRGARFENATLTSAARGRDSHDWRMFELKFYNKGAFSH